MLKSLEGARLGIFVFLGTVLFVIAVFLVGNKESLFVDTFFVKTRLSDVEGLKVGAPVRLSGIDIGTVKNVELVPDSLGLVEVSMVIQKDVQNFVRLNSVATVATEGLVGKKIVIITPGSEQFDVIRDQGFIKGENPISIAQIFSEAETTLGNISAITKDFAEIVTKVNTGKGSIGKLINDEELYFSAVDITKQADSSLNILTASFSEISKFVIEAGESLDKVLLGLDSITLDVRGLLTDIKSGKGTVGSFITDNGVYDSLQNVINNFSQASVGVNEGVTDFIELIEALKHNWLFKSYFEERGYWDKAEYETELENKLKLIEKRNEELDQKINKLKELEENYSNNAK